MIKKFIIETYTKTIVSTKHILVCFSEEKQETKEAYKILRKYIKTKEITNEEKKIFKKQLHDVLKIMGLGIPFIMLPGASVLLPIIVRVLKKYDIEILPSSFQNKK